MADDAPFLPDLSPVAGKPVQVTFDAGRLTSDGGVLLRAELERSLGLAERPRYFWALWWVTGLDLIGTIVLGVTGQIQRDDGKLIGIWYSLDMLLPVMKLRERHYDIDLEGFARHYFYIHEVMGYVLAFFPIAGLSRLTR